MKNLTGKDATMTITIKTPSGIESYFFYDLRHYGEVLAKIDELQMKEAI